MRWRPRNWLVVVAALFAFGFAYNFVTGEANVGDAIAQCVIISLSLSLSAFVFARREEQLRADLLAEPADRRWERIRSGRSVGV